MLQRSPPSRGAWLQAAMGGAGGQGVQRPSADLQVIQGELSHMSIQYSPPVDMVAV